jgi:hypothetical protein
MLSCTACIRYGSTRLRKVGGSCLQWFGGYFLLYLNRYEHLPTNFIRQGIDELKPLKEKSQNGKFEIKLNLSNNPTINQLYLKSPKQGG